MVNPEVTTLGELMTWANSRGMDVEQTSEGDIVIYTNCTIDADENLIPFEPDFK